MKQFNQLAEPAYGESPMATSQAAEFTLKRVGARPMTFAGSELCMAMSFVPGAPYWYEINVYRTVDQKFVLAIKKFHKEEDQTDFCRAWSFDDFGALMQQMEQFDPAIDVPVDIAPDDPSLTGSEMAAHALALRAKAAEARRQYRSLVGEVLHELEAD